MTTLSASIHELEDRHSLSESEMIDAMKEIMSGQAPFDEMKRFLVLLRDKGETLEEILGAARVMREFSIKVNVGTDNLVDTCGTGGDGKGTFNISTAAAFVVAGGGVRVAKHGNRAVSSKSGSADLLETLGIAIDFDPSRFERCLKKSNFAFLFAPRFHPAMKHVAPVRKEIGTRTIFNLLGPLVNPANPLTQVIGVFDRSKMTLLAEVLKALGSRQVFLVHGEDGLDEITLTGKTSLVTLKEGKIEESEIDPRKIGLDLCQPSDLEGGDVAENAHLLKGLLEGYECPLRDAVILNAAAAFIVSGRARDWEDGLTVAEHSLDQGKAYKVLKDVIRMSQPDEKTGD